MVANDCRNGYTGSPTAVTVSSTFEAANCIGTLYSAVIVTGVSTPMALPTGQVKVLTYATCGTNTGLSTPQFYDWFCEGSNGYQVEGGQVKYESFSLLLDFDPIPTKPQASSQTVPSSKLTSAF